MTTLYRSADPSAPVLTYAAGSMDALLKACLVDGYGAKPAAGWSRTVLDAASYKYAYSQGQQAGESQNHLYLYDPANHQSQVVACSSFTVSASPILADRFCSNNAVNDSVMLKADQTSVGGVAEWFMVADRRRFALFVKRENWKGHGWSGTFAGDIDSIYPNDKGSFSLFGRFTGDTDLPAGAAPDFTAIARGYVMGGVTGSNSPSAYSVSKMLTGSNYNGKFEYSGLTLTPYFCVALSALRGVLPFVQVPVGDEYAVSPYIFPDGYALTLEDGRVFKYLRVSLSSSPERLFIHIGGTGF